MKEKIYFIYDDTEKPIQSIRTVVGNRCFGEVIYKKIKLADRVKNILLNYSTESIKFIYLKNNDDVEEMKSKVSLQKDENIIYIHYLSSNVILDEEKFLLFIEKSKFINQIMVNKKKEPSIFIFPDNFKYLLYLQKMAEQQEEIENIETEELLPNDFGLNISTLQKFLSFFSGSFETRYFNSLVSDEYTITKRSADKLKMRKEHDFYYLLPPEMQKWMVLPYDYKENENQASYTMERLNIPDIALQWIHGSFDKKSFEKYLNRIFYFITTRKNREVSKEIFYNTFEDMYYGKIDKRIQELKKKKAYEEIDLFIKYSTDYNNIDEIFEEYKIYYTQLIDSKLNYIEVIGHGDPCFSNTLYDKSSGLLKLIDPKGALTKDEVYTNEYYDIAKLSHSILGDYDFKNNRLYKIELNNELKLELKIESNDLRELKKIFLEKLSEYGYNKKAIRICEASLFLSMLPLHIDIPSKVMAFILNAIEILKEIKEYE